MKPTKLAGSNPLISQLAFKIAEYIRSKNFPEGQHLVEQTLADEFHVSRSPIHKALQLLAKGKIVRLRRNQGFFLARPAENIPKFEPTESPLTEDEKYYQIAGDRVRGLLQGNVSEAVLRKAYGISRDKLTKILTRMAQEGWAEKRPGHGWNLPPILSSVDALDQSFRLRIILEPAALLEPTYRVDPVLFAELKMEQEELLKTPADSTVYSKMFEAGARFHEQIVACAGNPFFLEPIQRINRLRRLIEYNFKVDRPRLHRYEDHLKILELLEQGNAKEASDLLRHHLNQARLHRKQDSPSQTEEQGSSSDAATSIR